MDRSISPTRDAEEPERSGREVRPAPAYSVSHTFTQGPNEVIDSWWLQETAKRCLSEFLFRRWAVEADDPRPELLDEFLPASVKLVRRSSRLNARQVEFVVEGAGSLATVCLLPRSIWAGVAAEDLPSARALLRALQGAFPEAEPGDDETSIPLAVWTCAEVSRTFRRLEVQPWDLVRANYAPQTAEALERLMTFEPGAGGQLIIWHGAPGTGKSFALGALAHAWQAWASPHYVTDPEVLLADPGYLIELMSSREITDERWRLVILEDAGELFGLDAREAMGQSLSRLLNTTDGMLAQGSKALYLITTNEPVERFHPAVIRPGRCASLVRFERLPIELARKWFVDQGAPEVAETIQAPVTLAELFALARGEFEPPVVATPVGFQGRRPV
jgi:hypothetical protein